MITIIVAISEDNGIGFGNQLLYHLPGDLKRFKEITMGHCLIMGKKTWESLPKKPLAGRLNIVITDNELDCFDCALAAHSIGEALSLCEEGKEIFIIGGGSVYRQFLPLAERLLVTHIHKYFEADTFFPEISDALWYVAEKEEHTTGGEEPVGFTYTTYLRKT
ncbi:MAG TPA: dihydrofolate reductase [Bacteroidales bacterium]|nr:dihydrofolate reductase [Bacteroidales bacterium]